MDLNSQRVDALLIGLIGGEFIIYIHRVVFWLHSIVRKCSFCVVFRCPTRKKIWISQSLRCVNIMTNWNPISWIGKILIPVLCHSNFPFLFNLNTRSGLYVFTVSFFYFSNYFFSADINSRITCKSSKYVSELGCVVGNQLLKPCVFVVFKPD